MRSKLINIQEIWYKSENLHGTLVMSRVQTSVVTSLECVWVLAGQYIYIFSESCRAGPGPQALVGVQGAKPPARGVRGGRSPPPDGKKISLKFWKKLHKLREERILHSPQHVISVDGERSWAERRARFHGFRTNTYAAARCESRPRDTSRTIVCLHQKMFKNCWRIKKCWRITLFVCRRILSFVHFWCVSYFSRWLQLADAACGTAAICRACMYTADADAMQRDVNELNLMFYVRWQ